MSACYGMAHQVGRRVRLRRSLEDRAGQSSPGTAAGELLALVRSVRRWRPGGELKAERTRLVGRLRGELEGVEARLRQLPGGLAAGGELAISPGPDGDAGHHHRVTHLVHQHDEFLRRAAAMLTERAGLLARLARLDADGDAGRSAAVRAAIESAGGEGVLAEALAPTMPSAAVDALAAVRRDVAGLTSRIDSLDPETRAHAELVARRQAAESRAEGLARDATRQRAAAAGSLVSAALAGGLAAIGALEAAVAGIHPELAEALGRLRGDDAALEAVVEELIAPAPPAK
jgi:hypothetical protein